MCTTDLLLAQLPVAVRVELREERVAARARDDGGRRLRRRLHGRHLPPERLLLLCRERHGQLPQHERRDLQRKIVRLEIERELQEERHWCLSMLASVCGCEAKCCARLPRRAGRCMDCAACAVWLLVFAMIGFCLFFGVMFGFAIEDPAMTAAWLESVMFSIGFWIFCSRPAAIFAKTLIRRGKLARTAARVQAKRKHHAERRLLLLKSLQQQGVTVTPPSTMHSKMETDLVEMFQDEYRMYEHYSADIVSPKGRERFSGMQAAISL